MILTRIIATRGLFEKYSGADFDAPPKLCYNTHELTCLSGLLSVIKEGTLYGCLIQRPYAHDLL